MFKSKLFGGIHLSLNRSKEFWSY